MLIPICPDYDQNILDHFRGKYDASYVILQPFKRYKPGERWLFEQKDSWPSKAVLIQKQEPVTWEEVVREGKFSSLEELNFALLSFVLALRTDDVQLAKKLGKYLDVNNMMTPSKGGFDEFLIDGFVGALEDDGYHEFVFADEWNEEKKIVSAEEAKMADKFISGWFKNLYSPNRALLFTIHWDSMFVLFLGPRQTLKKAVEKYEFEGFWCTERTQILWFKEGCN